MATVVGGGILGKTNGVARRASELKTAAISRARRTAMSRSGGLAERMCRRSSGEAWPSINWLSNMRSYKGVCCWPGKARAASCWRADVNSICVSPDCFVRLRSSASTMGPCCVRMVCCSQCSTQLWIGGVRLTGQDGGMDLESRTRQAARQKLQALDWCIPVDNTRRIEPG